MINGIKGILPEPWMSLGICGQTDPEAFFPEKGGSTRAAKLVCLQCPVQKECLQYAMRHNERWGIWGGYSERERRQLQRGIHVEPRLYERTNRRANGHGYSCNCPECQAIRNEVA